MQSRAPLKLAMARTMCALTQSQLGRLVNVSQQMISLIENGRCKPGSALRVRLAKALGVSPEVLFDDGEQSD